MVRSWYVENFGPEGNPREEHQSNPPNYLDPLEVCRLTGIEYINVLDESGEINFKLLNKVKKERNYVYEDEELLCKGVEEYELKTARFFREHCHSCKEIRLVLKGSGYFDVRDPKDRFIRIEAIKGDLIVYPPGLYHRFTNTMEDYIFAKRYFVEKPHWTSYSRPAAETMDCRKDYLLWLEGHKTTPPDSNGSGAGISAKRRIRWISRFYHALF